MTRRTNYLIIYAASLLCLIAAEANAQILKDTSSINLIKKSIGCIYNFKFEEADGFLSMVQKSFPEHPVNHLLAGMKIYWENYPLMPASPARKSFEENLRKCMEISENSKDKGNDPEYLLADLCARGLLLLFYTDNDLHIEVFPLIGGTYQGIRTSFKDTIICADFFYFTGIYNYYREVYPHFHPVYKPLALLFPRGSRTDGIKQLRRAAGNSIMLSAESLIFLSQVFAIYEDNYQQALYYSKVLYELYPGNMSYEEEYIKNLLLSGEYEKAENLILSHGPSISSRFFSAEYTVFKGILYEKKYRDRKQAKEYYLKGAKDLSLFGDYGKEFTAYAYYGLSRISDAEGDKHYEKLYRKEGDELAYSKKINFD